MDNQDVTSDYEAFAERLRPFGAPWTRVPPHVIHRLMTVTNFADVTYLDFVVERDRDRADGQIVAFTKARMLVRLTFADTKDEPSWDKSTCVLRMESLRARVKVMEINQPDAAWSERSLAAGAVHLVLADPPDELTLPLTPQRDARAFMNTLSALID